MYCVKAKLVENQRHNGFFGGGKEKNGYGKGKFEKKKKIGYGVIHGVHISLFGGEGLFYPPPYATFKNLTNALCMDCTLCIDYTLHKRYTLYKRYTLNNSYILHKHYTLHKHCTLHNH